MLTLKAFQCGIVKRMESQFCVTSEAAASIRAELKRQKMSGRELARRLGVTPVYVSRRLRGEVDPSASDLAAIAKILEVTVGSLFGEGEL